MSGITKDPEMIIMAASRKLYREIAESIRTNMLGLTPTQAKGAAIIARAVADDLRRDNPNFPPCARFHGTPP